MRLQQLITTVDRRETLLGPRIVTKSWDDSGAGSLLIIAEPGIDAGGVSTAATMLRAIGEPNEELVILSRAKFDDTRKANNA